jgi:hypothetical protein
MTSHRYSRTVRGTVLALLVVAAACRDDPPPETRAATVEIVSGDQQQATVATALGQPVVARAVDAQGQPVAGARVEWQTTASGSSITAQSGVTDGAGRAQAAWTLGNTAGGQTATVRVGTATATFTALALAGPATAVTVAPPTVVLDAIGATQALAATARDAFDNPVEGRPFTWTTTAAGVATVAATGVVTAVAPGAATVRAALDGASGEAQVTVAPQVTKVQVSPPAPQLTALGATVQLTATAADRLGNPVAAPGTVVWTSANPGIATVSATGLVTAVANGAVPIQAAVGAVTGQTTVTVQQAPASLVVTPDSAMLTTQLPTVQLAVQVRDANDHPIAAPAVTWTSSSTQIATVSATGLVTAVTNGTAWVRAVSGPARDSAKIVVRLNAPPVAVADVYSTAMDSTITVTAPGLLANDTLGVPPAAVATFGGDSLGGTVTTNAAGSTVGFGTNGSLTVNANGSLTFTPSTGFTGSFVFRYRIQNVAGTADAAVTIDVGLGPTAVADTFQTTAGAQLQVAAPGVMANDDLGFPLAVVGSFGGGSLGQTVTTYAAGTTVGFGVGGFFRLNADGSLIFTPPTSFTGAFTTRYRLVGPRGTSDAEIAIIVN